MKLKAAVRYQAMELLTSTLVFCGIIIVLSLVIRIFFAYSEWTFSMSGLSVLGFVFVVIFAFSTFEGDLRFLLQSGLTRAQVLASCAISFLLAILLLTVVDTMCSTYVPGWAQQSLVSSFYGTGHSAVLGFIWTFMAYVAFAAVAFVLAALQMRIGTKLLLAALGITAVVILLVMPAVGEMFFGSAELYRSSIEPLMRLMSASFGFTAGRVSLVYPIISLVVVTALSALTVYLLTRRVEVR